jgi:hypothetical protein
MQLDQIHQACVFATLTLAIGLIPPRATARYPRCSRRCKGQTASVTGAPFLDIIP